MYDKYDQKTVKEPGYGAGTSWHEWGQGLVRVGMMSLSSLLFPPVVELERVCTDKVPGSPPPPRSLYSGEGINNLTFVIQLQQLFSATYVPPSLQPTKITPCVHVPSGSWAKCSTVSHTLSPSRRKVRNCLSVGTLVSCPSHSA